MSTRFKRKRRASATIRKGGPMRVALAALRGVKKLRSEAETKYRNITLSTTNITAGVDGDIPHALSLTAQGVAEIQDRIGNQITPTSFFMRLGLRRAIGSANSFDWIRVTLFWDAETNGSSPLASSLYENGNDIFSALNRKQATRYRVIYDKMVGFSDTGPGVRIIKKYFRLSGTITYNGAGEAINDADSHHLFLFVRGFNGSSFPTKQFYARLNYKDT